MLMTRWKQQARTQGNTEIIKESEPVANGVVDNDDEKEAKCWLSRTSLATTRSTQEITEITEEERRKMPPTCNLDQPLETSSYACLELHASCLWRWYIVRNSSQWHSTETKFFCQSRFVSTSWCGIQSGFRDSDRSFNSVLALSLAWHLWIDVLPWVLCPPSSVLLQFCDRKQNKNQNHEYFNNFIGSDRETSGKATWHNSPGHRWSSSHLWTCHQAAPRPLCQIWRKIQHE